MVALNTNYDRGPGARPFIHDLTNRVSGAVAAVNHAADAAAAAANDLLGAVVSFGALLCNRSRIVDFFIFRRCCCCCSATSDNSARQAQII